MGVFSTTKKTLPTITLMQQIKNAKTDQEKNTLLNKALAKAKENGRNVMKTRFDNLRKVCKTDEEKSELAKTVKIREAEEARWAAASSGVNSLQFPVFTDGFAQDCPNLRGTKPRRSLTKEEITNGIWGIENMHLNPVDVNARAFPLRTYAVNYKTTSDPLSAVAVEEQTVASTLRSKVYEDDMQFWQPVTGEAAWKVSTVAEPMTIQEKSFNDSWTTTQLCPYLSDESKFVTEITGEAHCGWRVFKDDIIKADVVTKKQMEIINFRKNRTPLTKVQLDRRLARMAKNFAIRRSVPKYLSPRTSVESKVQPPCAEFFGECINVFMEKDVKTACQKYKLAEENQVNKLVEVGSKYTVLQRVNGKVVTPSPTAFDFKSPQQHAIKDQVMHKRDEERIKKMAEIRSRKQ